MTTHSSLIPSHGLGLDLDGDPNISGGGFHIPIFEIDLPANLSHAI